jgi:carboxyl-terminal processing protease
MSRGTSRSLFFVLLVIVTCGFLGSAAFSQRGNSAYPTGASDNDVRDSLHQFSEIYNLVEQNYAEPVNTDKAIYNGAIPGMLKVLDSNFFDPSRTCPAGRTERQVLRRGYEIALRKSQDHCGGAVRRHPAYKAGRARRVTGGCQGHGYSGASDALTCFENPGKRPHIDSAREQ